MNIELLDKNRVLIDLCDDDMELLSLEYSTLSMRSQESKKIIKNLVNVAQVKAGFQANSDAIVLVEAMPYDGGCFVLITLKESIVTKGKKFRVLKKLFKKMFCFDNCEDMLCAIEKLYSSNFYDYKSSLILYNENYYLLIQSLKGLEISAFVMLNEYCYNSTSNSTMIAHIMEQGKIIIENNAVEKAGGAICR